MPRKIIFPLITAKLKSFYGKQKRLPSFSELQTLCHYKSKGSVAWLVDRLVEKNILKRDSKGRLLPTSIFQTRIRLLGEVQAGFPSPAEEELIDTLSLDEYLIQKPDSSFLVKVTGDSMIDAGILPGDLVIVERGRKAKSGDIVIAQVDGQWTMKYLEEKNGKVTLRAANKKYPLFSPKEELVIGGVVTANVRKYR